MKPVKYGLAVPGPLPTSLERGTAHLMAVMAAIRKQEEEKRAIAAVRIWRAAFGDD